MATSATWWAGVAFGCLGLRLLTAIAIGARLVSVWSGPLVEVLLWIGVPALVDSTVLRNPSFWLGFLALMALWAPVLDLAGRTSARRSRRVVLVVVATLALAIQMAVTQVSWRAPWSRPPRGRCANGLARSPTSAAIFTRLPEGRL